MKYKNIVISWVFTLLIFTSYAQEKDTSNEISFPQFFIAYDFGEAMFNKFQSISGEVGVRLKNNHLIRLVHMNVWLTEEHLSSDFVVVVDGENVKGRMIGIESFYSIPIIKWRQNNEAIYLSPSMGYYYNEYTHTELGSTFSQQSPTAGLELSYREVNPFGVKGLYYTVSIPARIQFNPHKKATLGNTTIQGNQFDSNIWFFIGYQF